MRLQNEAQLKALIGKGHARIRNNNTRKNANMESDFSHAIKRPNEIKAFDSPVDILVHSYRYRLCDPDGISIKWALDAIVKAGILIDDKSENIKEIRFKQTKIKKPAEESTVVTISEVE
jgi:hypothetical protein